MNNPTRKLLEILSDGKWHVYNKLPKGIGVNTARACIDQGFVTTRRFDRRREGDLEIYQNALRITQRGRVALQEK